MPETALRMRFRSGASALEPGRRKIRYEIPPRESGPSGDAHREHALLGRRAPRRRATKPRVFELEIRGGPIRAPAHLISMRFFCCVGAALFGRWSTSTPSFESAWIFSASTFSGRENVRRKEP